MFDDDFSKATEFDRLYRWNPFERSKPFPETTLLYRNPDALGQAMAIVSPHLCHDDTVQHERAHFDKALELGFNCTYCGVRIRPLTGSTRAITAFVYPDPGSRLMEELDYHMGVLEVSLAPVDPSPGDYAIAFSKYQAVIKLGGHVKLEPCVMNQMRMFKGIIL